MKIQLFLFASLISIASKAQQPPIQYFRANNKTGLNIFETTKQDSTAFSGMKVRIGGNFTQDFQGLSHQNNATAVYVNGINSNQLASLSNGFNLAMANLNIDVQLADGIRMNLTMYLSSRHHDETWIKGGYIQFDKLLFLKSDFINDLMKNLTIKAGDYEVDYGDQHFRRTDGGNAIFNPFIENYIIDEFATEIGTEIYFHPKSGFLAMAGITNGQLNPTVISSSRIDSSTNAKNFYAPAFHGKIGFDRQFSSIFRFRLTGSAYVVKSTAANTLFFGDRTGSHYFFVMENSVASASANAWSGRYNPQFSEQISTFMINPFVKFRGLELFGTYEVARGRMITEAAMRTARQSAVDLIYRFPRDREDFWVGGRFNTLTTSLPFDSNNITINRSAGSVGWFVTRNIVVKAEYVNQQYRQFTSTDIRANGKFNGYNLEATIGF